MDDLSQLASVAWAAWGLFFAALVALGFAVFGRGRASKIAWGFLWVGAIALSIFAVWILALSA